MNEIVSIFLAVAVVVLSIVGVLAAESERKSGGHQRPDDTVRREAAKSAR